MQQLKRDLAKMELRSRRANLEIHGIPKVDDDNLLTTANEIKKIKAVYNSL